MASAKDPYFDSSKKAWMTIFKEGLEDNLEHRCIFFMFNVPIVGKNIRSSVKNWEEYLTFGDFLKKIFYII